VTATGLAADAAAAWRRVASLPYAWRLALAVAVGAALRIGFLARQPLWRDEAFTAIAVGKPLGEMLAAVSRDSAPPLSYVLDHAVVAQLGTAPWTLRLVSAFAGIALIAVAAALGRRIAGDRGGIGAAVLVACAPATVIASQDARMYALGAALGAAALLLLWRAVEAPTPGRWLAYAVVAAAAAWTVYFDALALVAAAVAVVAALPSGRAVAARAAAVTAAAVATLLPWLVVARAQFEHAGVPFWVRPLGPDTAFGTAAQFLSGPPVDPGVPLRPILVGLQAVAVGCGSLALVVLAARRRGLSANGRHAAALCCLVAFVGVGLLVAMSVFQPLLEARYASVLWPSLYAAAGAGLALARPRWSVPIVAGLLVASLGLSAAVTHPETAALVPAIASGLGPDDVVLAYPTQYLLLLHDATPEVRSRLRVIGPDVPWYWGTAVYPDGAVIRGVPDGVAAARGRVLWVVEPDDPAPVVPAGYRETGTVCVVRACLRTFEPAP